MYNFKLYDDFCDAVRELGLELRSKDGGCVYVTLPGDLNRIFYAMLWTPLNKLDTTNITDPWKYRLDHLRSNHDDFHLEFATKETEHGTYWMFPEVNNKHQTQITKQDIKVCIERMLDTANFEQNVVWAKLQEPEE